MASNALNTNVVSDIVDSLLADRSVFKRKKRPKWDKKKIPLPFPRKPPVEEAVHKMEQKREGSALKEKESHLSASSWMDSGFLDDQSLQTESKGDIGSKAEEDEIYDEEEGEFDTLLITSEDVEESDSADSMDSYSRSKYYQLRTTREVYESTKSSRRRAGNLSRPSVNTRLSDDFLSISDTVTSNDIIASGTSANLQKEHVEEWIGNYFIRPEDEEASASILVGHSNISTPKEKYQSGSHYAVSATVTESDVRTSSDERYRSRSMHDFSASGRRNIELESGYRHSHRLNRSDHHIDRRRHDVEKRFIESRAERNRRYARSTDSRHHIGRSYENRLHEGYCDKCGRGSSYSELSSSKRLGTDLGSIWESKRRSVSDPSTMEQGGYSATAGSNPFYRCNLQDTDVKLENPWLRAYWETVALRNNFLLDGEENLKNEESSITVGGSFISSDQKRQERSGNANTDSSRQKLSDNVDTDSADAYSSSQYFTENSDEGYSTMKSKNISSATNLSDGIESLSNSMTKNEEDSQESSQDPEIQADDDRSFLVESTAVSQAANGSIKSIGQIEYHESGTGNRELNLEKDFNHSAVFSNTSEYGVGKCPRSDVSDSRSKDKSVSLMDQIEPTADNRNQSKFNYSKWTAGIQSSSMTATTSTTKSEEDTHSLTEDQEARNKTQNSFPTIEPSNGSFNWRLTGERDEYSLTKTQSQIFEDDSKRSAPFADPKENIALKSFNGTLSTSGSKGKRISFLDEKEAIAEVDTNGTGSYARIKPPRTYEPNGVHISKHRLSSTSSENSAERLSLNSEFDGQGSFHDARPLKSYLNIDGCMLRDRSLNKDDFQASNDDSGSKPSATDFEGRKKNSRKLAYFSPLITRWRFSFITGLLLMLWLLLFHLMIGYQCSPRCDTYFPTLSFRSQTVFEIEEGLSTPV